MKKQIFLSLIIALLLSLTLSNCKSSSDDSGGAGAEFDASQYYTKTEVDEKLSTVITGTSATGQTITGNDSAGGTATGWTVPTGTTSALFSITISNYSGATLCTYIGVGETYSGAIISTSTCVPNDGNYYATTFWAPVTAGTNVKAFHDYSSGHSGVTDLSSLSSNFEISVKPVTWLK